MLHTAIIRSIRIPALLMLGTLAGCKPAPEAAPPAKDPPAAAAAPASNDAQTFSIGDLSAVALRDGGVQLPNDNKVFGVGLTPAAVGEVLSGAGLPTDTLQLSVQPLLVKSGERVLLFDTGAGTNMGPTAGQLSTALAAAGVAPGSVTDVFISHLHGDHVGGLVDAQGALVFANARIHLSEVEWKFLSGLKPEAAAGFGIPNHAALVAAITPKVSAFAAGAEIVPGVVRAVDVKGHTPGHSAYLVGSGSDTILYIGDAMHHYVVSVQKPEWTVAFDNDGATAAASRRTLLEQSAASGQRIYAVHFPYPGIGKIEKRGEGFAWVAE